ncbi:MAG: PEP-CTERM sorting domain-containing protein [Casimicrobiaceae bacterium]
MEVAFVSLAFAMLAGLSPVSQASLIAIDPVSDGSLYTCEGCTVVSDGDYVVTAGYIQGAIKFPSAPIAAAVLQAVLTINPYGLPLFGPYVDVYGYGTFLGQLDASDANAGTVLGTLALPENLDYGQDAFFDVTAFVSSTAAPFLAFNLRSTGSNVFSSLEYNYGHASQLLVVTAAPEPGSMALVLVGFAAAMGTACRRRRSGRSR